MTKRRQMIYEYFKQHPNDHPTAEEVYLALKKEDSKIGVATVYRNLNTLVSQGLLKEINLYKQGVRYDLIEVEHYHFLCDRCGTIENIKFATLDHVDHEIEQELQSKITSKDVLFHGICKDCLNDI